MNGDRLKIFPEGGFSLLELLVATSMALGVAWLSASEIAVVTRSLMLNQEAMRLRGLLTEARVLALEEHRKTRVVLDNSTFSIHSGDESRSRRQIQLPASISVVSHFKVYSFYPEHVSQPARILLYQKESFCELTISLRGRIRKQCS